MSNSANVFRVIQQQPHSSSYVLHLFECETHFKAWAAVHGAEHMRPASQTRAGSLAHTNDHRSEIDARVDKVRDTLELGSPAFDMKKTSARKRTHTTTRATRESVEEVPARSCPEILTPVDFGPTLRTRIVYGRMYQRYTLDRYDMVLTADQPIAVRHPDGQVVKARVLKVLPGRIEIEFEPCNTYKRGQRSTVDMTVTGPSGKLGIDRIILEPVS